MKSKLLYAHEWVRVRNFMNKNFPRAAKPCSMCRHAACKPVWYNIRTHDVRCFKCFDAEALHWGDEMYYTTAPPLAS